MFLALGIVSVFLLKKQKELNESYNEKFLQLKAINELTLLNDELFYYSVFYSVSGDSAWKEKLKNLQCETNCKNTISKTQDSCEFSKIQNLKIPENQKKIFLEITSFMADCYQNEPAIDCAKNSLKHFNADQSKLNSSITAYTVFHSKIQNKLTLEAAHLEQENTAHIDTHSNENLIIVFIIILLIITGTSVIIFFSVKIGKKIKKNIALHKAHEKQLIEINKELDTQIEEYKQVNFSLDEANQAMKRSEEKLLKFSSELQSVNESKDKFISILAHDLKNPFNTILGFSGLMLKNFEKYDASKNKVFIEEIFNSAKNTYSLLENLLGWANLQNGKIKCEPECFKLSSITNNCIALLEPSAKYKGVEIKNNISDDIMLYADSKMIMAVIRNLLSNSIKFTSSGGTVSLMAENSKSELKISVSDTGTGMDKQTVDSLFKIDSVKSKEGTIGESGTGLGLMLCYEFISIHNGKIWAESELNKGSIFTFTIPFKN